MSDDEDHKDAILALQEAVAKKREEELVQVKQDKVKRLGKWDYMGKRLTDEENTVAKLKEPLEVYEESIKERKTKMTKVKTELDAAVADLNEARQHEQEEAGDPEEEMLKHDDAGTTAGTVAHTKGIAQGCNRAGGTGEPQRDGCTVEPGRTDVDASGRAPRPAGENSAGTEESSRRGCTGRRRHGWRRCVRHAWCALAIFVHVDSVAIRGASSASQSGMHHRARAGGGAEDKAEGVATAMLQARTPGGAR